MPEPFLRHYFFGIDCDICNSKFEMMKDQRCHGKNYIIMNIVTCTRYELIISVKHRRLLGVACLLTVSGPSASGLLPRHPKDATKDMKITWATERREEILRGSLLKRE